ncbi:MAG: threonylcarbamoyl-AMP synthase [Chloroflexi bacterium]|nr:threonylcarbamoyl-AMP synthase [Chloroflexota bacterium]
MNGHASGSHRAETRVTVVDPQRPDPAVIERAAKIIRRGGLVAFPTETVYGLGANALDADAVQGIFRAKQRALNDPLIVHLASADDLPRVARDVPPIARALAARFWPGPLTLVLPKRPEVPDIATAGLPTVAVRVPSHPVARALITAAGLPIAAPSANLFMRTSATTAAHVVEDLGERVDLILDGGPAPHGIESTVVAVGETEVRLLRPGATTAEAVADALAELEPPVPLLLGAVGKTASPGLLARHYSPRAALFLFTGEPAETRPALAAAIRTAIQDGRTAGALLVDEDLPLVAGVSPAPTVVHLGSERDLAAVAGRLFAGLRELDAHGCEAIYARSLGTAGLGLAILDRLTRAAHRTDVETTD